MTDRPILFSAPMVRALLDGTKTQTRRVINPQPPLGFRVPHDLAKGTFGDEEGEFSFATKHTVGDRLYVREHWKACAQMDGISPRQMSQYEPVLYLADGCVRQLSCMMISPGRHRQGMHMPRWASRLTLIVAYVRVERLQDISDADAIAEGIVDVTRDIAAQDQTLKFWKRYRDGSGIGYTDNPIGSYASLWTSINGAGAWEANPWVAAYNFKIIKANINEVA